MAVTRTPLDIPFDDLESAARAASERANEDAKAAGLSVEGMTANRPAAVLTLGHHMCKWPIGDPGSGSFTICGRFIREGSYCAEHAILAYLAEKSVPRRARKASQSKDRRARRA